jgi:poly(3-hydroxybutyrate) depolymerase
MQTLRLAVVLSAASAFVSLAGAANVSDFINFSHPSVPGRLYVPPEAADHANPRPLILFLHGSGETGTNNILQINGNIDNLLQGAKDNGAFLYAPQATTFTWADPTRTANVMSMIDQALLDFNVDPNRLYVTGLSMGGGGVWNMLNRYDDRFAAVCRLPRSRPEEISIPRIWWENRRGRFTLATIASSPRSPPAMWSMPFSQLLPLHSSTT